MTDKKKTNENPADTHDKEAQKQAVADATPSGDGAKAADAFAKAVEKAREAGLQVTGRFSFMEGNVSHNKNQ